MSVSLLQRQAGINLLIANNGEQVSCGTAKVNALVTRNVTKIKDGVSARDGKLDFEVMGMTEIELTKAALQPQAGNTFIDLFGFRHRVRYVTQTDITWVCYCTPSQQNPPQ